MALTLLFNSQFTNNIFCDSDPSGDGSTLPPCSLGREDWDVFHPVSAAACIAGGHDLRAEQNNTGLWSVVGLKCAGLTGLVFGLKQKNKTKQKPSLLGP